MATKPRVAVLVRQNENQPCAISGCHTTRHSLSKWCCRHQSTNERNGHPQGAVVRPSRWKPYSAKVHDLLASNLDHAGLVKAEQFVKGWMQSAVANADHAAWADDIARLHRAGVTPLQVITELAACWSYLQDNPRACLSDDHRTFTLSKAVLGLTPRPRRFSAMDNREGRNGYAIKSKPAALRYIGHHLVQVLSALLVNVHQNLNHEQDQAAKAVEDMRQPFGVSTSALAKVTASSAIYACVPRQLRK